MKPLLVNAAEALRDVAGGSFEVEVSAGEVSLGSAEGEEESKPRETALLTVRRGSHRWDFRAQEVGRLTKEHAAQLLSSADLAIGLGPKDNRRQAGREASLLVSEHVTEEAGRLLRSKGACYLDATGNCHLRQGPLLAFVRRQEAAEGVSSERPTRAFNAAGLKLIFVLLSREEAAGWTYRRLSKAAGASRGAVGYVMEDLRRLGFLEEAEGKRRLRREPELLERWTQRFAERLRPKLSRGRFRFVGENAPGQWRQLKLDQEKTRWGGEPAAGLLVGDLRPKQLTLYSRQKTSEVCKTLGMAPDEEGPIEILDMFWDPGALEDRVLEEDGALEDQGEPALGPPESVPPLLVYADLIAGADPRGVDVAPRLREKYLPAE
jgi:hypothetical protein